MERPELFFPRFSCLNNNMENFEGMSKSGIEKIRRVQGVSPEREEQMLSYFAGYFEGQQPDPKLEREKTLEEQEVLEGIVASMPDFIKRYGGDPIVLKPEYMHVIDPAKVNAEWSNMTEGQRAFIAARKDEEGWTFGGHTVGILRGIPYCAKRIIWCMNFCTCSHLPHLRRMKMPRGKD